jgi:hypothetical protein
MRVQAHRLTQIHKEKLTGIRRRKSASQQRAEMGGKIAGSQA